MVNWPAAKDVIVEVPNPLRHMDEYEPDTLRFRQRVPPAIGARSSPSLDRSTNRALAHAMAALADLSTTTVQSGIRVDPLLTGILIRLEAVSSSQIEDLDADIEEILVQQEGPDEDDGGGIVETTELSLVAHNIDVVARAVTGTNVVEAEWFHRLHRQLMNGSDLLDRHVGAWRDVPVWIGPTRARATFEAPDFNLVPDLMRDLIEFTNRHDVQGIVQAGIAHAQFETIHPFVDGNGRIGRALVHPILRRSAPTVIVPASHALLANREGYFAALSTYRDGDLDTWLATFAEAVADGARAALRVTQGLADLREDWNTRISTYRNGAARDILNRLPMNPVVTVASVRQRSRISQPAASTAIKKLETAGVLRRTMVPTQGRAHVWIALGVLDILMSLDRTLGQRQTAAPSD